MKLFVSLLFFALTGVDLVYPLVDVSSNITAVTGEICPETVQFTCVATDFETTLSWGFDTLSSTMLRYILNTMDTFPLTIFDDGNVTVIISSAVQNQQDLDRADFTSTLTVSLSTLIYRRVQRVFCGTSLENDNYILMLNDVTVRAPPPRPVFTCFVADDGGSVTFNWNRNFNSDYSVNQYCVEFDSCSACNISPNRSYVCNGLQAGQENVIIFKAINCDVQQGAAENVTISLQRTTQPPSNVEVVSLYNSSPLITNVTVKWSGDGDQYSVKCDHKSTTYIVTLQNTMDTSIEREVDSDSCENSICSASFNISEPEGSYSVSVNAVSIIGTNSTTFPSTIPANATSLLRASFEFANCITYATCSSDVVEDGNCGIRYSSISDSGSVTGMLNGPFALPLLTPDTRYDFVTNLTMNSGLTIEIETTFVTGNFDPKLTGSNTAMIVVGIIITVIVIVCEICGAIAIVQIYNGEISSKCLGTCSSPESYQDDEHKDSDKLETPLDERPRDERPILVCILISYGLSLILACVTIVLWISLGGVVGQQQNTCDVSWQTSRDNLTTASLVFSISSLLVFLVFVLIFVWIRNDDKVSAWIRNLTQPELVFHESHFSLGSDSQTNGNQDPCTSEMTIKGRASDATTHSENISSSDISVDPKKQASSGGQAGNGTTTSGDDLQMAHPPDATGTGNGEASNEATTSPKNLKDEPPIEDRNAVTEPRIIRQPQPCDALVDEIVTFTVAASSKNYLTFKWKFNGNPIEQDSDIEQREFLDGKNSIIQMKFSPTRHAGMYKCVVKDLWTDKEVSSNEVQLKAITEPIIIRQPQPWGALDEMEENVTFTVAASSKNDLTFNWTVGGKSINERRNIKQTESPDGKTSTIQMKFMSTEHVGMCKCVVQDKVTNETISSDEVELKDFEDELKTMKADPLKNELVILIIGKGGIGKATLFNSLMGKTVAIKGLIGGLVGKVTTESVDDKTHVINNIKVRLVDIPISNAEFNIKKVAERFPENGKDIDLVIYCVSIAKDSHLTNADDATAVELTKTYDQNIWEKTLFALTFANSYGPEQEEAVPPGIITELNQVVANCTKLVRRELLKGYGNLSKEVADSIPIIPVGHFTIEEGKTPQGCCTLPDGSKWIANFWYQSLMRIPDPQARYAFYQATSNIHPYLRDCGHRETGQAVN